jgi:xylulokinase
MVLMEYFLGIDVGTFESKGMIIDVNGNCIDTAFTAHEMISPKPGYCEHDAEAVWWGDLCKISKELLQKTGIDPKKIRSVACSAIGPCLLPVDKNCKPLAPAILYGIDVRAEKQICFLNEKLGADYVLKKYGNPITSQSIGPKLLWLKENLPESYKKAAKFITSSTYMSAKLTGQYCIDRYTAAYFTPMYNLETNDWDYDNLFDFCQADQLADCRWADEIIGTVTSDAAKATGLAEGTQVTVGTADAAADAVGVGVFNPGDMLLMFGSSVYIIHVVPHLITDKRFWAGPFLFKDTYMVASGMSTTGTLTRWFRDQLAPDLAQLQKNNGKNAYDLLLAETENCPPGSGGLICLPYFSGERTPINDPSAKGMFFGLTLHHTRAHMYQSCLEGIGYGIEQHFRGYREIGMETKKVIAVGGGTKSRRWMQIVSDICGKKLFMGGVYGAAYGDALLAAFSSGAFPSIDDISKRIIYTGEVLPNSENTGKYKPFVNIYTQLYQNTKDLMMQL